MDSLQQTSSDLIYRYMNESPELRSPAIDSFFETLSRRQNKNRAIDISPGDLIIRRQYGHHQRSWLGIVEDIQGNEAIVVTTEGRKRVKLYADGRLHWELRLLRPGVQIQPRSFPTELQQYERFRDRSLDDV